MTRFIGLIGYPLKHSISHNFQQAALDYYKLDIRYEDWETRPDGLASTVSLLRQAQNLGANITVPHKEATLHLVDRSDEFASMVGAVNTVVNRDGILQGFNTDGYGFLRALRNDAGFKPVNRKVLILGAGGAARAVAFTLLDEKVSFLLVANRSLSRAENLANALAGRATDIHSGTKIAAAALSGKDIRNMMGDFHLIINCTTVGMKHSTSEGQSILVPGLIPKGALVYDLVYNPAETPLMKAARAAGARTIGGLPMLVYQGAASFKLWTGREAPLDIMLSAATSALAAAGG